MERREKSSHKNITTSIERALYVPISVGCLGRYRVTLCGSTVAGLAPSHG